MVDVRGLPLTSNGRATEPKVSGRADDMAVHLRDHSVKHVVDNLDDFGIVLVFLTNRAKPMVTELDYRGSQSTPKDSLCFCLPIASLVGTLV